MLTPASGKRQFESRLRPARSDAAFRHPQTNNAFRSIDLICCAKRGERAAIFMFKR
jgi:hypothetical protein